jgi:predicted O-linked N-acetylglucosamine transferase (SPINDLY family)
MALAQPGAGGTTLPATHVAEWQAAFRRGDLARCEALARGWTAEFARAGKAWQLLGVTALAAGHAPDAAPVLQHAAQLASDDWTIWDNLGIARQRCGDFAGAAQAFARGMELAPTQAGVRANASLNALESGDAPRALALANDAIRCAPSLAIAHLTAGNALSALGRGDEAEAAFRRALALQPAFPQALLSLGREQGQRRDFAAAAQTTARALALDPNYADAHVNLANLQNQLGDIDAAAASYRRARELQPAMLAAWSGELYCRLHDTNASAQQVAAAHFEFGTQVAKLIAARSARDPSAEDPGRRLRLGFVSGDLREHPVAHFLEPAWRLLDRELFALHAYDTQPGDDAVTRRLRARADGWTVAAHMNDATLDACIRADGIDILFDLSGHTAGNRLGVFARKPAPVQVSWIGYPGTTGLAAIDYRFVDRVAAPPGRLDAQFSERLAYLPFMSVFERPDDLPAVAPAPCLTTGAITFASFNRVNKLSSSVIALWARVLAAVPSARLLLAGMPDDATASALRARFVAAGVAAERLQFRRRVAMADYLAMHAEADVLLDSLPFSSGTTANFALWLGVPTLTLAGDALARRLGAMRMAAAGLEAFVAESEVEYVALAAHWAARRDDLIDLRAGLRARMEASAQRQPRELAAALERRLREMWRRWCAGQAPETLA